MGLLDLSAYKVTNNVDPLDATVQDSMLDAITAVVNALTNANIDPAAAVALSKLAGFPSVAGKYADGLGNWSIPNGTQTLRKNSTTDVNNTTTVTDMTGGTLVIPAGAMGANGIVKVSAWGDYLNNTGSNQSIAVGLLFGGVGSSYAINPASSAVRGAWAADWFIDNLGLTNSQQQGGHVTFGVGGTFAVSHAAMAVDTTASVALQVQATLATASPNLSMRCHGALVQVFAG